MADSGSAWKDAGEQLTALGHKLSAHYDNQRGMPREESRAQAEDALRRLGQAVQDAFEAVGAAAKDDAVKQDAKSAGRSLLGALDATFKDASAEVRKRLDRGSQP
jgi:uncharacterized membrane protein YccC